MKILLILSKLLLALTLTFLLFITLPILHDIFTRGLYNKDANRKATSTLMKVERKKKINKKVQKLKPRKIKSHSRSRKSKRASSMKFSPDLSVGSGDGIEVEESNLENVVFEEGEADVSAIPISKSSCPFPNRAKEAGIGGIVNIIILIDRKGNVEKIDFVSIPHMMFKTPVSKCVKKWKFKPAMNKGVPVKMRVRQVFEFNLED